MCHCGYEKCKLWNPLRRETPQLDNKITLRKYLENLILFAKKKDSIISDIFGWPGTYWIQKTFELNTTSPVREYIKTKYTSFSLYHLLKTNFYKSLSGLMIFKTLCKRSKYNNMMDSHIRTIRYVIAKIKNRSNVFPSPKFDRAFDFWFMCKSCGGKLLDDEECWHAEWCNNKNSKVL